ncbi:MAG TPA: hypothetical protein VF351_01595 [Actinomycetota bacterium]
MRARTAIVAMTVLVAIGLTPAVALANGGAYVTFEGRHHLPGDVVTGELYVSIPRNKLELLDRGPFHAYLLEGNDSIEAGRPLPSGAIRVGTFVVEKRATDAELAVTFTVPDVVGDYYNVGLCNDPCTLTGFGEPVSGSVSIVATAREASLLTDNSKLQNKLYHAQRDLRKMEKSTEAQTATLTEAVEQSESAREQLSSRVEVLEAELASARAAAEEAAGRPLIDPWAAAAVAVALLTASWALAWRRHDSGNAEAEPVPEGA